MRYKTVSVFSGGVYIILGLLHNYEVEPSANYFDSLLMLINFSQVIQIFNGYKTVMCFTLLLSQNFIGYI